MEMQMIRQEIPNNLTVYNATLAKRFNNDNSAYYFNGINAYLETLI